MITKAGLYSQADSATDEVPAPEQSVEEVWSGAEGPASIAELALDQRGVHFPLVQHHCLLASLLHATMSFSIKVKPLSLFDNKVSSLTPEHSSVSDTIIMMELEFIPVLG